MSARRSRRDQIIDSALWIVCQALHERHLDLILVDPEHPDEPVLIEHGMEPRTAQLALGSVIGRTPRWSESISASIRDAAHTLAADSRLSEPELAELRGSMSDADLAPVRRCDGRTGLDLLNAYARERGCSTADLLAALWGSLDPGTQTEIWREYTGPGW